MKCLISSQPSPINSLQELGLEGEELAAFGLRHAAVRSQLKSDGGVERIKRIPGLAGIKSPRNKKNTPLRLFVHRYRLRLRRIHLEASHSPLSTRNHSQRAHPNVRR